MAKKTKSRFTSLYPHRKYKPEDNIPGHMASKVGYHVMGDIEYQDWQLCEIVNEISEFWIGYWVMYPEVMNVMFPKTDTRKLTAEEQSYLNKKLEIKTPRWLYGKG